jgi:hypothetical protein
MMKLIFLSPVVINEKAPEYIQGLSCFVTFGA